MELAKELTSEQIEGVKKRSKTSLPPGLPPYFHPGSPDMLDDSGAVNEEALS